MATKTVPTDTNNVNVGAGTPSKAIEKKDGILNFAEFAQSLAFKSMLATGLSEDGRYSLHDYLNGMMSKFYHQLYYIPNLKDNKITVIKPETLFVNAPSCNVIYPNMKGIISYARNYKGEPTRLVQVTDPVGKLSDSQVLNYPVSLYSLVHVEEELLAVTKHRMPVYKSYVMSIGEGALTGRLHSMNNISRYEMRNGIRSTVANQGADLYLFLTAVKEGDEESPTYSFPGNNNEQSTSIANMLTRLARYELCRQRYMMRNGSVDMYFNPYIVPGFPMINVEPSKDAMNIYGYVTSVVHNLTERSWTTTVSFTAAHTDDEQTPGAFPIIESEYTDKLPETYTDMLGDSVVPVGNEELPEVINAYNQENTYITQSYRKVWRETPTLASYLEMIADGATVVQDNEFMVLQNNPNAQFFDPVLQERLKEYSRDILAGRAFALEDVN